MTLAVEVEVQRDRRTRMNTPNGPIRLKAMLGPVASVRRAAYHTGYTHTQTHIYTDIHTHTIIYTYTHAHLQIFIHTHTHTHACKYTDTK